MSAAAKKPAPRRRRRLSRSLGRGLLLALLLVALAGAGRWLLAPETLPVRTLQLVSDAGKVREDELHRLLQAELGANFLRLPIATVCERLEAHPWIERAVVRKRWPDRLVISLDERRPVARWGSRQLVDAGGVRYPADTTPFVHLPLIHGPDGEESAMLSRFEDVDRRLSRLGLRPAALLQSERRSWHIETSDGLLLELGREQFEHRLTRFERVWPQILAPAREGIEVVDLRYANGFTVKRAAAVGGDET